MAAERSEAKYPEVMEAPRYSCALGGALSAALGVYGTVPILHSGAGCGQAHLNGQSYGCGENAGGPSRRHEHSMLVPDRGACDLRGRE